MAKVIAIVNQKGGVAKSTSCVNLGIGLVKKGYKVALIIYSCFFYMLIFQFFADFFFQYFWVTFQTIIFTLFLFFCNHAYKK